LNVASVKPERERPAKPRKRKTTGADCSVSPSKKSRVGDTVQDVPSTNKHDPINTTEITGQDSEKKVNQKVLIKVYHCILMSSY